MGHAVAKLVEALCYKPEGSGFESRCGGFFSYLPNISSRTMALGSTQPLIEMSPRNLPGAKGRPARKADNLTAICEPIVYKMWGPRRLTSLWAFTACYRNNFTLPYPSIFIRRNICLEIVLYIYLLVNERKL
jgi:hypothetical protein